jgi:hypothetical protein
VFLITKVKSFIGQATGCKIFTLNMGEKILAKKIFFEDCFFYIYVGQTLRFTYYCPCRFESSFVTFAKLVRLLLTATPTLV